MILWNGENNNNIDVCRVTEGLKKKKNKNACGHWGMKKQKKKMKKKSVIIIIIIMGVVGGLE